MQSLVRTTSVGKRKFEGWHDLIWNKETKVRKIEDSSSGNLRSSQEGNEEMEKTWQQLTMI